VTEDEIIASNIALAKLPPTTTAHARRCSSRRIMRMR